MTRFSRFALTSLCILIAGLATSASAEELKVRSPTAAEVGKMVNCEVMNVKFEVAKNTPVIDYKGKPYFFCCDHCVGEFMKNPAKFAEAAPLKTREPTAKELGKMVTCQVMNVKFEVAKNTPVIDYKGKSYYFCCDHCVDEFKQDPDKFAAK